MTIVMTFDKPIQSADPPTITEGVATFSSMSLSTTNNDVVLNFTGVTDKRYVTFNLDNVASTDGGGSGSVRVSFLFTDVNQDRQVRPSDVGLVGAAQLHTLTNANFLYDVNVDGKITPADRGLTNANQLKKLPTP